jgi:hypothetical protein
MRRSTLACPGYARSLRLAAPLSWPVPDPGRGLKEQEKAIKYSDLVSNAVIFQNVVVQTRILRGLIADGYPVTRQDVATMSPYLTSHIKWFGDYIVEFL